MIMAATARDLDRFARAYIDCALWSSTGDDGKPLDATYSADDIHLITLRGMADDCRAFLEAHAEDIGDDVELAAHDYWLTRNRHGSGFWDGGWESGAARRLTVAAHADGPVDLCVGDDGYIHSL